MNTFVCGFFLTAEGPSAQEFNSLDDGGIHSDDSFAVYKSDSNTFIERIVSLSPVTIRPLRTVLQFILFLLFVLYL